jgi:hypothetical protein
MTLRSALLRRSDAVSHGRPRDSLEVREVPRVHAFDSGTFSALEDQGIVDLAASCFGPRDVP